MYIATGGSVVYVIRLALQTWHDHNAKKEQHRHEEAVKPKVVHYEISGCHVMSTAEPRLSRAIRSLAIAEDNYNTNRMGEPFIHNYHIEWLEEAITHYQKHAGPPNMSGKRLFDDANYSN